MGLSILTSIVSALSGIRVRSDLAMTGEITLRGKVLRVQGLEHKILAAHHAGIKQVIVPRQNEADLDQIPAKVRDQLQLHLVSNVSEALALALVKPLPRAKRVARDAAAPI